MTDQSASIDHSASIDQSASETWFDLPSYIEEPYDVYVNGIPQQAGTDYRRVDRALVFPRAMAPEVKMTPVQWFLVTFGIGSYQKHDSVDILYEHEGRRLVATGLRPREPAA